MHDLGRSLSPCVSGLRDYHRTVRQLRHDARSSVAAWRLRDALEQLLFDLEVDVAARSGARAQERMTPVEAEVFRAALVRLRDLGSRLEPGGDPSAWQAILGAMLAVLRQAVRQLHGWTNAAGVDGPGSLRREPGAQEHVAPTRH